MPNVHGAYVELLAICSRIFIGSGLSTVGLDGLNLGFCALRALLQAVAAGCFSQCLSCYLMFCGSARCRSFVSF